MRFHVVLLALFCAGLVLPSPPAEAGVFSRLVRSGAKAGRTAARTRRVAVSGGTLLAAREAAQAVLRSAPDAGRARAVLALDETGAGYRLFRSDGAEVLGDAAAVQRSLADVDGGLDLYVDPDVLSDAASQMELAGLQTRLGPDVRSYALGLADDAPAVRVAVDGGGHLEQAVELGGEVLLELSGLVDEDMLPDLFEDLSRALGDGTAHVWLGPGQSVPKPWVERVEGDREPAPPSLPDGVEAGDVVYWVGVREGEGCDVQGVACADLARQARDAGAAAVVLATNGVHTVPEGLPPGTPVTLDASTGGVLVEQVRRASYASTWKGVLGSLHVAFAPEAAGRWVPIEEGWSFEAAPLDGVPRVVAAHALRSPPTLGDWIDWGVRQLFVVLVVVLALLWFVWKAHSAWVWVSGLFRGSEA